MTRPGELARRLPQVGEAHVHGGTRLLAVLACAGLRASIASSGPAVASAWEIAFDSDFGQFGFVPLRGSGRPLAITSGGDAPDLAAAGAALAASEPLIVTLERALGTPLWPGALSRARADLCADDRIEVRLDADGGDRAWLRAAPDLLGRLPAPRWDALPKGLRDLDVSCRIGIGGCAVDAERIAAIKPGDLLLETTQGSALWTVRIAATNGPQATATLSPASRVLRFDNRNLTMMDSRNSTDASDASRARDVKSWTGVPTALRFELPGVTLPFGAVAGLQPGAVMRIAGVDTTLSVEVFAGSRVIGRGELVAIGDSFGVRMVERLIEGP